MSNVMNTPAEGIEGEYPLVVEEQALPPDSGGAGAHRGGLGFRRADRVVAGEVPLTSMLERRVIAPGGLFGGAAGAPYRLTGNPGMPAERPVKGKETLRPRARDLVVIETAGSGGYGAPADRPPALTAADHREGYLA